MTEREGTELIRNRIEEYGSEIDRLSAGKEYDQLKVLLNNMEAFKKTSEKIRKDIRFNYYIGTGYGAYTDYLIRSGKKHTDSSIIDLRRQSFFYLRKALDLYDPATASDQKLQLRILTNYANGLDTVGRCLEALRLYRRVLIINNQFSIARGNYGRALQFLANIVNDQGHYNELHCYAYQSIRKALTINDYDMHERAIAAFQDIIDKYESMPNSEILVEPIVHKEYQLGEDEEEIKYRKWCLQQHLFLNPMNDVIETESAFAHDPLTIAVFTDSIYKTDSISDNPAEPPRWFAMINQLKEEYVYARYLCFEGSEKLGEVHFADKNVKILLASYDYTNYSIRIEQMKSSFRILYSMLDQICFFINDFWELGLGERDANAHNICKAKSFPKDNIALTSLYWVICEFFESYGEAEVASEDSLKKLRHAFEHKYVKVHEYNWDGKLQLESDGFYHISENQLKKQTLRLLQISREALMYLVYAFGMEEKKKGKGKERRAIAMPIADYRDEWKT